MSDFHQDEVRRQADMILNERLGGIESTLQYIRGKIESVIILEERQRHLSLNVERMDNDFTALSVRVAALELSGAKNGVTLGNTERILWALGAAALALLMGFLKGHS